MTPELHAQLDAASASGPIGLLIVDGGLKVVAADRMFTELFGCESEELVGRAVEDVFDREDLHSDLLEVLLFGGTVSEQLLQARLPGPNGKREPRMVKISASSVRFEDVAEHDGLFIVVEDLTMYT